MRERPRLSFRRAVIAGALLAAAFLASGCASAPRLRHDLPPLPQPAPLETASPAARDALEAGLRWIAADAPGTTAETSPEPPSAEGARK